MTTATQILKDLFESGYEIYTAEDERQIEQDEDIYEYMSERGLVMLYNNELARFWYFRSIEAIVDYFRNGHLVSMNQHASIIK